MQTVSSRKSSNVGNGERRLAKVGCMHLRRVNQQKIDIGYVRNNWTARKMSRSRDAAVCGVVIRKSYTDQADDDALTKDFMDTTGAIICKRYSPVDIAFSFSSLTQMLGAAWDRTWSWSWRGLRVMPDFRFGAISFRVVSRKKEEDVRKFLKDVEVPVPTATSKFLHAEWRGWVFSRADLATFQYFIDNLKEVQLETVYEQGYRDRLGDSNMEPGELAAYVPIRSTETKEERSHGRKRDRSPRRSDKMLEASLKEQVRQNLKETHGRRRNSSCGISESAQRVGFAARGGALNEEGDAPLWVSPALNMQETPRESQQSAQDLIAEVQESLTMDKVYYQRVSHISRCETIVAPWLISSNTLSDTMQEQCSQILEELRMLRESLNRY